MRRGFKSMIVGLLVCGAALCGGQTALAATGQMGFFGGINEGTRLPKTTEVLLADTGNRGNNTVSSVYKEMIFLSGRPVAFEGTLTVRTNGGVEDGVTAGTYRVTYTVASGDTTADDVDIDRTVVFDVNYRREGRQVVKDYELATWRETLTTPDGEYDLDPDQSRFGVSILEDQTPGVVYYKGNLSQKAVYVAEEDSLTVESSGSFYGYDSVWSNTETHRIDCVIDAGTWQMAYQLRPSVSVNKLLQYAQNEPTAISFDGNYREVMANKSGMQYTIFTLPQQFYGTPTEGGLAIGTYNSFEQLIAPDTAFLKGHAAESDIKKLYAMGILSDEPKFYQPAQALSRAEFTTMLVKAIKLPVALPAANARARRNVTINIVFPDVSEERPDYPYIMAAYEAGLAVGRGNGHFYADFTIHREEAAVILLRTLGLSNLGLDPTPVTPFADDADISGWAKQDLYAAYKLNLIKPDINGKINPKQNISKAEAAALVNALVEYMRSGMQSDYTEHIVNYAQ